jgi:hypothetical protein
MPRVALTLFAAFVAAFVFSAAQPQTSTAETVIESSTVQNGYPTALTFKVTARADSEITDITLNYAIKGRGTSALGKPASLTPGKNLSADVVIQVNNSSNYLPVGSDFVYHWEIATADGQTFTGPEQTFFYLPPNQDWKNVSNDFMTVYYHGDRESIANAYLRAGAETYDRIGKQLYKTTLTQLPVKVIMFADEAESDLARPGSGGRFDAAVTTCGTKVTNDIVLVIPIACGSTDRTDTLRHEFGHILNETAGEGTLAKLPSWLDEGAAVYAQSGPGDYQTAFTQAARANRLIPFSQMTVPASNPQLVGVFYGQAWAMVSFLIDKGGEAKFGQYMSTIKGGKRYDQALNDVYGFANLQAFEDEFKAAVGVGQQASPTARPTSAATRPAGSATTAPTRTPSGPAANTSDDDGNGVGAGTIVLGAVTLFLLLGAVFAFLISMMMANNRKEAAARAAGSQPPAPPSNPTDWSPPPSEDSPPGGD